MNPDRPCLNYHIKRCLAPCAGYISKADYHKMIKSVCMVLDGRTTELERDLKQQMQEQRITTPLRRLPDYATSCRLWRV